MGEGWVPGVDGEEVLHLRDGDLFLSDWIEMDGGTWEYLDDDEDDDVDIGGSHG